MCCYGCMPAIRQTICFALTSLIREQPDTLMQTLSSADQRRNVVVNVLDAGFWVFGISFMSATTILPVFLRHLTDSPLLIGLVAALLDMGWFLPQIFIAPYVQ